MALRLAALLLALTATACSGSGMSIFGGSGTGGPAIEASAVPAGMPDPVAAFVARAAPGDFERLPANGGPMTNVRMNRAWNAASGRQCREVQIGAARELRTQVYCQDGARWVAARPLLQGSLASSRP